MSGAGIEAPYAIASLPKPFDSEDGQTLAAPVHGFRGSKKRRRHEVVVGVDGEGVYSYNIQTQSLVASYALPPNTYLCCQPCSVVCKTTATGKPQRTTALAVRYGAFDPKRQIITFTEDGNGKSTNTAELAVPERRQRHLPDGDIAALDLVPTDADAQLSAVITYRNGDIVCLTTDMLESRKAPLPQAKETRAVESAFTLDTETARKGLLKGREDVVALLDQNGATTAGSFLLCQLTRLKEARKLDLFIVRAPAKAAIQTSKPTMQCIMSYDLPMPHGHQDGNAQYEFHASSGMLFQVLNGKLNVYDLSGITPRLRTQLGGRSMVVSSCARVSSNLVLAIADSNVTLYETKYGSVQASASLLASSSNSTQTNKRKRDGEDSATRTAAVVAIASFVDLGLVVGLSGNELVALQLGDTLRSNKKSRSHDTLLSDVMGKSAVDARHVAEKDERKTRKFEEWKAKVDHLVEEDGIEGLERLIANDSTLCRQGNAESKTENQRRAERRNRKPDRMSKSVPNGDIAAHEESWPLLVPSHAQHLDRRKVLYILGVVFVRDDEDRDVLRVEVFSPQLLEWLALTGFLSSSFLAKAMQQHTPENKGVVRAGDIMLALREQDAEFELMHRLLSLPTAWELEEIVQALRLLVQSFEASPVDDLPLALPAPPQPNGDITMTNGDDTVSDVEHQSEVAELELDRAMSVLNNGLELRSDTLRVVLARLRAFPPSRVTTTMRKQMSRRELIFFVHVLRIELAEAGWTSRYSFDADGDEDGTDNHTNGEEQSRPNDQAIVVIGDLLNCAVDAIGTSGWLIGLSSEAMGTEELLDSLRTEISAGLEGCYEATTLGMFLHEVERCATSTKKRRGHRGQKDLQDMDGEKALLPLGGRSELPDFVSRSGELSKMAVAQEKSKRVGKYSFDRIRI